MFYAPGLIGYSAVKIASPTFYSLRDSRTPVIVSVLSVGVNLALNLALVRVLGFKGLALGTAHRRDLQRRCAALAAAPAAGRARWTSCRRVAREDRRRVGRDGRGGALHRCTGCRHSRLTAASWPRSLRVAGSIAVALLVLAASARLLRIQEFNEATSRVLARFGRRPA